MNRLLLSAALAAALAMVMVLPLAVTQAQPAPRAASGAPSSYVPPLGEFMLATQARHAKLWFAGNAQNWELADYLIDELKEGLEAAVKFVPELKGLPVGRMIESTMDGPIAELEKIIKAKDRAKFTAGFNALTGACNACHQAASRPFLVIQRPATSPFPNQSFAPAGR
jgi:hypothetical protein